MYFVFVFIKLSPKIFGRFLDEFAWNWYPNSIWPFGHSKRQLLKSGYNFTQVGRFDVDFGWFRRDEHSPSPSITQINEE